MVQDRDRQTTAIRRLEDEVKEMEYNHKDLSAQHREKTALEEQVETLKKECSEMMSKSKVTFHESPPTLCLTYVFFRAWIAR